MKMTVDLSHEHGDDYAKVSAKVLAILFHNNAKLYAVTTIVGGAPLYALIHENSTAFLEENDDG